MLDKNLKNVFEEMIERKIKPLESLKADELIKIFLLYA